MSEIFPVNGPFTFGCNESDVMLLVPNESDEVKAREAVEEFLSMFAEVVRSPKIWEPIETVCEDDTVDLWLDIPASPMSMGMADSFCVKRCWHDLERGWVHRHEGETKPLRQDCITHWTKSLTGPNGESFDVI